MPQLYLLAVDACRLLGLPGTPRLYIRSSSEAAAYCLQVPSAACPPFHGLNGELAAAAAAGRQESGSSSGGAGRAAAAAAPAAEQAAGGESWESSCAAGSAGRGRWECALVLTSALVDLLGPLELQAVLAGCLGFHVALTCEAANSLFAAGPGVVAVTAGGAAAAAAGFGSEAARQQGLCRGLGAVATLGALCALCPDVVARRLPPQLAPLFATRIQPALLRGLRYLALYGDRCALGKGGCSGVRCQLFQCGRGQGRRGGRFDCWQDSASRPLSTAWPAPC